MIALAAIFAVTGATVGLGAFGVRYARTTSDLWVASRAVTPWWNAAAVSGEYLSAASFLGIAGLGMKLGGAALWLPLGFTAGYVALLLFVAAPLRRFGAYTIADFAEARLRSRPLRHLASAIVLGICGFYLVPQLKGAGLALHEVTGAPYAVGVLAVGLVVAVTVATGGMRGITYVQAFQYWLKTFAIALPICVLLVALGGLPDRDVLFGDGLPRAPAGGLTVTLEEPTTVTFPEEAGWGVSGDVTAAGVAGPGAQVTLPAGTLRLAPGTAVPVAEGTEALTGAQWSRPVADDGRSSPWFVYSLLLATVLGTMGLPHIAVRFYTAPDGPAARSTTVRVLLMLSLFYAFPAIYGALGRVLVPELYVTGQTDSVVLRLPQAAWPGLGGELLGALVAAGAFAAFLSTASGLMVAVAGTLAHDVFRAPRQAAMRRRRFRQAAVAGMVAPMLLALGVAEIDISILVGWAFALAASTFCPLLLLGIWWSGLTARGAAAGLVGGTVSSTALILAGVVGEHGHPTVDALLTQPAVVSVPVAFALMVLVSRRDPRRLHAPDAELLRLHAPEGL